MFSISNISIEIIQHPKLTMSFENSIRFVRSNGSERLHYLSERDLFKPRRKHVNVIGHDYPCGETITLAVGAKQHILNHGCDTMLLQESLAVSLI